jgi:hypothetical protein
MLVSVLIVLGLMSALRVVAKRVQHMHMYCICIQNYVFRMSL